MQVILLENIPSLGKAGDLVKVSDGYGRNYLIPQNVAYPYAPGYLKMIENEKKAYQAKLNKEIHDAETISQKITVTEVTIEVQAGEEDKLFGSVTAQMIADKLAEPIKSLGTYKVPVKLHQQVSAEVVVNVVKQPE